MCSFLKAIARSLRISGETLINLELKKFKAALVDVTSVKLRTKVTVL